jgi:hypothetical protein
MARDTRRKPYKFTAKKRDEYLELLRAGQRRGAAAHAVGVTRQTVSQYKKRDLEFAALCDDAEMDANEEVEDALFQAALSGNVTAVQVWLYNRWPDRWADRRNVRVTGEGGGPVAHKVSADLGNLLAVVDEINPEFGGKLRERLKSLLREQAD